jgi:ribonuclease Z
MGFTSAERRPWATIQALGVGEAFSSTEGNTAFWVKCGEGLARSKGAPQTRFLVDFGYQIPERLWALSPSPELDAIFLTHFHADHAFGLVPFLVREFEEKRSEPLTVFGPPGVSRFVQKLLDLGYPGVRGRLGFPLQFEVLRPGGVILWRGIRIQAARTRHSVLNLCLQFQGPWGSFSVSGDGALTSESRTLALGSDVHFQECYTVKPGIPTHANLDEILRAIEDAASSAEIQGAWRSRIFLTHFSRLERVKILRELLRWKKTHPGLQDKVLVLATTETIRLPQKASLRRAGRSRATSRLPAHR